MTNIELIELTKKLIKTSVPFGVLERCLSEVVEHFEHFEDGVDATISDILDTHDNAWSAEGYSFEFTDELLAQFETALKQCDLNEEQIYNVMTLVLANY